MTTLGDGSDVEISEFLEKKTFGEEYCWIWVYVCRSGVHAANFDQKDMGEKIRDFVSDLFIVWVTFMCVCPVSFISA